MRCELLDVGGSLGDSHDVGRRMRGGHCTVVMTAFSAPSEHVRCSPAGPGVGSHSKVCIFGGDSRGLRWPCGTEAIVCSESKEG